MFSLEEFQPFEFKVEADLLGDHHDGAAGSAQRQIVQRDTHGLDFQRWNIDDKTLVCCRSRSSSVAYVIKVRTPTRLSEWKRYIRDCTECFQLIQSEVTSVVISILRTTVITAFSYLIKNNKPKVDFIKPRIQNFSTRMVRCFKDNYAAVTRSHFTRCVSGTGWTRSLDAVWQLHCRLSDFSRTIDHRYEFSYRDASEDSKTYLHRCCWHESGVIVMCERGTTWLRAEWMADEPVARSSRVRGYCACLRSIQPRERKKGEK
jgi:hypothetical protein